MSHQDPISLAARGSAEAAVELIGSGLDHEYAALERHRSRLAQMRTAVLTLRTRLASDGGGAPRFSGGELIPAGMAVEQVQHIFERTDGLIRTCAITVEAGTGTDEAIIRIGQDRLAAGRPQRAIYPAALVDDPGGRRWMRSWEQAGEQQRLLDDPPGEFAVFGDEAVITTLDWQDPGADSVLIREPLLVRAYTSLFDLAFTVGLPVPRPGEAGEQEDVRLLEMMAMGVKDEAIGRYLGWSLRTVRRRVARLMDEHGVDTRFQLGAAVTAAGLIDPRAPHGAAPRRAGR